MKDYISNLMHLDKLLFVQKMKGIQFKILFIIIIKINYQILLN